MNKSGIWYLPESEFKVPGKLKIGDNKILLTLFCNTTLTGHPLLINKRLDVVNRNDEYCELILGDCPDAITLYSCSFYGCGSISDDLCELTYKVEFIFDFIHIRSSEHLKFKNVFVKFPSLDSFYGEWEDEWYRHTNPEPEQFSKIEGEIQVTKNLLLKFIDTKQKLITATKNFDVRYSKQIRFDYINEVHISDINKDCYTFLKLFEFTSRKKLSFRITNAIISLENVLNVPRMQVNFDGKTLVDFTSTIIKSKLDFINEPFDDKSKWHQNWLLISRWKQSQNEIDEIIKTWFQNEQLFPIYDFYIDSFNWFRGKVTLSNVMYNNKFLNLIQGLEAYYDYLDVDYTYSNEQYMRTKQDVLNLDFDTELKEWLVKTLKYPKNADLVDKLKLLKNRFDYILKKVFNNQNFYDEYPKEAKDMRHQLSHGRIDQTYQGPKLDILYKLSQILMCMVILDSLKIPLVKIEKIMFDNVHIKHLAGDVEYLKRNG